MLKTLPDYFEEERKRAIERCLECGVCVKKCSIFKHVGIEQAPQDIQKKVMEFLKNGADNETVYSRAFACMGCYECVDKFCSQGLNPLLINEIIKQDYINNRVMEPSYPEPKDNTAPQRVLASIQVSAAEYKKISKASEKKTAKYVFFPGCNVYNQPEKILSALDVLDFITRDYAFVPGLDFCCGDAYIFSGSVEKGDKASKELIARLSSFNPEMVILWCPTCLCRFNITISPIKVIPFNLISFPQFLAQNMDKLPFKKSIRKKVTLHEPCKSAFTGFDLTGSREVLQKIPGVNLVEMPRHGKNTWCCGSGAVAYFPNSFEKVRDERLREAVQTGADALIDVCHYCHEVFIPAEQKYELSVTNYVSLVADALGIERQDKFKKYKHWGDLDKILDDAVNFIKESPYAHEKIIEVVEKTFVKLRGHHT